MTDCLLMLCNVVQLTAGSPMMGESPLSACIYIYSNNNIIPVFSKLFSRCDVCRINLNGYVPWDLVLQKYKKLVNIVLAFHKLAILIFLLKKFISFVLFLILFIWTICKVY